MASERDVIAAEHLNKLRELYFLVSSGLQPLADFSYSSASTTATHFFDKNEICPNRPFLLTTIPRVRDIDTLKREIASNAQLYLYRGNEENSHGKRPHEAIDSSNSTQLKDLGLSLPSGIPYPAWKNRKVQVSQHLRNQLEGMEQETDRFLRKRIADVDVLTVPEYYPTLIHNSISLLELYYLTQLLPLFKLLPGSHKALTTENFELALLEGKIAVLYSRIEELKRQNKWSLRQPLRYYDPFLYAKRNKKAKELTLDSLLREAKWMAVDFKEIQKFKKLCCIQIAQAIREYWVYGKDVCIKTKPIEFLPLEEEGEEEEGEIDVRGKKEVSEEGQIKDGEDDVMDVDSEESEPLCVIDEDVIEEVDKSETNENAHEIAEQAVESLDNQDFEEGAQIEVFGLDEQSMPIKEEEPASIDPSKLLSTSEEEEEPFVFDEHDMNLEIETAPISQSPFKSHININDLKKIDQSIIRNLPKFTAFDDDSSTPLLSAIPVTESSIIPTSRMLYPPEKDDEWYKVVLRDSYASRLSHEVSGPPPYQKGLFGTQSHRKFNFLKPPKPPLVKDIKYRSPTIWLPRDDQLLIHCVAEYCFNWDLIAANLLAHSPTLRHYTSTIEKRTPWQCFERYIQLNDKFQFRDMKGSNAAPAQIWLEEAHNAQLTTKRRISPFGVGNESIQRGHKKLRWASMFEAIRKTMKRREIAAAKSANSRRATPDFQSASIANSSNIATGQTQKRPVDNASTPQELSKLKHDRDKAIQEAYFQRQASRSRLRAGMVQRRSDQLSASGSSPAPGGPMDSGGSSRANLEAQRRLQQQRAAQLSSDPSRASPSLLGMQPGALGQQAHSALAQHQAKQLLGNMKAALPNPKAFSVEQVQKAMQLEKQRMMLQQKGQKGSSNPPSPHMSNQMMGGRKPLESMRHPGSSPTMLGAGVTAAGSPPAKQGLAMKGRLQYSPEQFAKIVSTIQEKNPTMSKEQARKVAMSYLANILQQQQASRAAQGGSGVTNAQEALKARQAQVAARKAAAQGKDADTDDRGKASLAQESYGTGTLSSPYSWMSGSRANSPMEKKS